MCLKSTYRITKNVCVCVCEHVLSEINSVPCKIVVRRTYGGRVVVEGSFH